MAGKNPTLVRVVVIWKLTRDLNVAVEIWLEVIAELVSAKFTELNKEAFLAGQKMRGLYEIIEKNYYEIGGLAK